MRLLAIGATGFIGRNVVSQLLAAGHEVAVLHRGNTPIPGVTEILGDCSAIRDLRPRLREWLARRIPCRGYVENVARRILLPPSILPTSTTPPKIGQLRTLLYSKT